MKKMTTKQIIKLVLVLITILFIISYSKLMNDYYKQQDIIQRYEQNISKLNTQNSELIFENDELNKYLKNKDTEHKIEVDSILNLLKVKPRNLIKYQKIIVNNKDNDTTGVHFTGLYTPNDTTFTKHFESIRKCLTISGVVYTKDSSTNVVITSTEGTNTVYVVETNKKTFWDWLFKRPGKKVLQTTNDCGQTSTEQITIKKED